MNIPVSRIRWIILIYDGYFQVVQAVLEFYEIRTKEAGRSLAIQRASAPLGVNTQEFAFITKAHEQRNGTSYVSPFPPPPGVEG
ncbi:MAG TPA: hypothetical protein VJS30_26935 [Paraburkholderia sp.]|nr:hypothetical protein [Paraburkholderia sp.]